MRKIVLGSLAAFAGALLFGLPTNRQKPSQANSTPRKTSFSKPTGRLLEAIRSGRIEPIQWTEILWSSRDWDGVVVTVAKHALGVRGDGIFTRVPVSFNEAIAIARENDWTLPTAELENAIWNAARVKLAPQTVPLSEGITSEHAIKKFNRAIDLQIERVNAWNELTATEGKAWILSPRNTLQKNRVANYGWHRLNGEPIQPLGPAGKPPVHDRNHWDYSQTFRPIQRIARRANSGEQVDLLNVFVERGLPFSATAELRANA